MTSQRDNIIIAEHGIITQEALLAYLNNELTDEQRQQLEQLLKNDPFSQDALEGLRSAQDKGAVSSSLITIRRKVNERIGKKEKRLIPFHWSNYAYAAVIIGLLISVAFILTTYFNKRQENIAMNKANEQNNVLPQQEEIKQAPPAAPATNPDTVAAKPSPATGTTTPIAEEKSTQPTSEKQDNLRALKTRPGGIDTTKMNGSYKIMAQKSANEAANNAVSDMGIAAKQPSSGNGSNSPDNSYFVPTPTTPAATSSQRHMARSNALSNAQESTPTTVAAPAAATAKTTAPKSSEDNARKTFFSGDYKKSELQYDSILQVQPDNSDALFFGGISDYVNGDFDKAGKNFDELLAKNKRYVDGAKWYKANILLKKGQRDAGINLLQELAHSGGSYKERAKKKLAEMQNQ